MPLGPFPQGYAAIMVLHAALDAIHSGEWNFDSCE